MLPLSLASEFRARIIKVRCVNHTSTDYGLQIVNIVLNNIYSVEVSNYKFDQNPSGMPLYGQYYRVYNEDCTEYYGIYPQSSFQTINDWRDSQINKIFNE
jgi:hypothetical protein